MNDSVYQLALNCSSRHLSSEQFLVFYNEFFNEKFGSIMNDNEEGAEKTEADQVYETIVWSFIKLLQTSSNLLIADYIVEIIFIHYNPDLVRRLLPQIHSVENHSVLIHFYSRSSAFFFKITDKLVVDQISKDLGNVIIPSVLNVEFDSLKDQLVVSITKFLQSVLKLSPEPITIINDKSKNDLSSLLIRLSKVNRLLYKKVANDIELKLNFSPSIPTSATTSVPASTTALPTNTMPTPSITSPQFVPSPLLAFKTAGIGSLTIKYQDVKLTRYYKNLWLNNKINDWNINDSTFLLKYQSITASTVPGSSSIPQTSETVISDLVETAFICFGQFVSNKQYHQTNANFNLLERKWILFITKRLPLLVLDNIPGKPHVVMNALENIDDKVVKAIKSYYSDKEDSKNSNDDLFDDFPSNNLDIRHDFLKNLIMLKQQPPNALNELLREDQMVDLKTLRTNDNLIIANSQGVQESVDDLTRFITNSLDSLEAEMLFNNSDTLATNNESGVVQMFQNFEAVAATKQREIATIIFDQLSDSIENFDHKKVGKLCGLLSFNFGHSLTAIFTFLAPEKFVVLVVKFLDKIWDSQVRNLTDSMGDESDLEYFNEFVAFTMALVFVIHVTQTYDISLQDALLNSGRTDLEESFVLQYVKGLGEIPDEFRLGTKAEFQTEDMSTKLLRDWAHDLFVNGSISDSLMKSANVKDLSVLVPFIFKQSVTAVEIGNVKDISVLIGGFEYFLQPFMMIGLIKIVFWLEDYLNSLKSRNLPRNLLESIFDVLNSLFNPSTLNEESKPLHNLILRLGSVNLLKSLKHFRVQSQSNYGIYSSDSQGDPKLELLISKLESISTAANFYNVDPRILNSDNSYSQKQLGYTRFLISNDNPINKIMANQINSFWNLHSSTYYNLDYLIDLIKLVTPRTFLEDVFKTLHYKINTYGVPGMHGKVGTAETDYVLDYLFYFLVLHDIKNSDEISGTLRYLESDEDFSDATVQKEKEIKLESATNPKKQTDEDFDILFGDDTSSHVDDDIMVVDDVPVIKKETNVLPVAVSISKRGTFALVLHDIKVDKTNALSSKCISKEDYDCFKKYYDKYIEIAKKAVI